MEISLSLFLDTAEAFLSTSFDIVFPVSKENHSTEFHSTRRKNFFTASMVAHDWVKPFDLVIQSETAAKTGHCLVA